MDTVENSRKLQTMIHRSLSRIVYHRGVLGELLITLDPS